MCFKFGHATEVLSIHTQKQYANNGLHYVCVVLLKPGDLFNARQSVTINKCDHCILNVLSNQSSAIII